MLKGYRQVPGMEMSPIEDIVKLFEARHKPEPFIPGVTKIPYSGRVFDSQEFRAGLEALLEFHLTAGKWAESLEAEFKIFFNSRAFLLVNSGSSANLLMIATLMNMERMGLKSGDEVITPAVTFPTTLSPLIQLGLVPVFVDCEPGTYNMSAEAVQSAMSEKTRAIFVPHTLGSPNHLSWYRKVCDDNEWILVEDCCDALGAEYDGKKAGTYGDLASLSFYPAHHMTLGEGGGVVINRPQYMKTAVSLRDWGRDCWCPTGKSDTCGKRFDWKMGGLPHGYDHKYIYRYAGYNLKLTDLQAAIGVAQFQKLPGFIQIRRENFDFYLEALKEFEEHLELPKWDARARPSWFGFPIMVREHIQRNTLTRHLETAGIETRLIFAGNVLKQPAFQNIHRRVVGSLTETDRIMEQAFFIGVYPGLNLEMKDFVVQTFRRFFKKQL